MTTPRKLCREQKARFVRACWYRAFLERPPKRVPESGRDLLALCRGLDGLQHEGCVTGASLIVSPDPFDQMHTCSELRGDDAAACVRGVRVPSVALSPLRVQVRLVKTCAGVDHPAQHACYAWLGKALNVIRNGGFGGPGCSDLRFAKTRAACADGARAYDVLAEAADDPSLKEPLTPSAPAVETGLMGCEVLYAFRREMAQKLSDVLLRRTMVAYGPENALDVDEAAAAVAVKHLGWSEERAKKEVAEYREWIKRYTPKALREREGLGTPGRAG
jgi:hypothetical protein